MNKKTLKNAIIIISIIIICIIILIAKLTKSSSNTNGSYEEKGEYIPTINKTFRKIDDYNLYYTAKNIVNNYIKFFENINSDVSIETGRIQMTEKEIREYQYKEAVLALEKLFDKQYKDRKNLNEKEIVNYVNQYKNINSSENYKMKLNEMYIADITDDKKLVLIYSTINNKDFNCMLKIDLTNNRFSIFYEDYMKEEEYTKERTEEIKISNSEIEQNDYNMFILSNMSNQNIAIQYFSDLKEKMLNDRKSLYDILDKEYKEKKFQNYEKFEQYIKNLSLRISKLEVSKFKFSGNIVNILDNYNNIYTFKIDDSLKYTILLDDYTIENQEEVEIYNRLVEKEKVNTNIEKFFKMINLKDYESAYNLLDSNFKKNNYPSLDTFKNYIENNLYSYSKITKVIDSKKSGKYYVTVLNVINGENEVVQAKQVTVIMELLEDTNFVMSFSME